MEVSFSTRQQEKRTREARQERAKASPRKVVTHRTLRVTRKAFRALEKGLTKTNASFAMQSQIRHVSQSIRSVEGARSLHIIFVNKCSASHIRVVSAGSNLGDQGYVTDCISRCVLDETQRKHASTILRKHDPRQQKVHEPRS